MFEDFVLPIRKNIEDYTFVRMNFKKITIPDFIEKIGSYAFLECENLTEIIIPSSVREIGTHTFYGCKNLKRITLPDSLETLSSNIFNGCENLEEIVLPKNIKTIDTRAFANCKRLKKVIIPESIKSINSGAFVGCENLEEIILPNSLENIEEQAFAYCKKLKNIVIPKNIYHLPNELFKYCKNLNIELPSNITSLGKSVFENCYKLTKYPSTVTKFEDNCFKNCKSLDNIYLNENIKSLQNGSFDGCINLKNIYSNNKLTIGARCFRNCKNLTSIPTFVSNLNERAFENSGLKEITLPISNIPFACFRNCKNLEVINNEDDILKLGSYAFSGCNSLKEISLERVTTIPSNAFSNCKNLSKVKLNFYLKKIGSRAFYGCQLLKDLDIPDSVEFINKEAFRFCNSIEEITIPTNLKSFGDAAFACMDSLETINVSPANKTFITPDNKILIDQMQQKLVLYVSGSKDKTYSLKKYNVNLDWYNRELIKPITNIGEYAFAGAKNLEELSICSCSDNLEYTAFQECPNLKKLYIEGISLFTAHGFKLRDHGRYYMDENAKDSLYIPFETVEYKGEIVMINRNALDGFYNLKNLILPKTGSYTITSHAFNNCKLKRVFIPKNVTRIEPNAFDNETILEFNNGLKVNGLVELLQENEYSKYKELFNNIEKHKNNEVHNNGVNIKINLKGLKELTSTVHKYLLDYTLYTLDNDNFYVEQDDKITTISKQYIDKSCSHSEYISNNPVLFIDFMNDLIENDLAIKPLFNGILMSKMNLHSRKLLIENFKKDDNFFLEVLLNSGILDKCDYYSELLLEHFEFVINKINILKKYNIKEPLLFNKVLIYSIKDEVFEELIKTNYELLIEIIKESDLIKLGNINITEKTFEISTIISNRDLGDNLLKFIDLMEQRNKKDKFLMKRVFITNLTPLSIKFIKNFDENLKRLIKASKILDGTEDKDISQNFVDLLNLLEMTGALSDDPITRQKACTYITEKIFEKKLPNGKDNNYRIVGDDIHRFFNFSNIETKYNKDFSIFFLENYKDLNIYEKTHSGFIERIYKNFEEISRTCTSDKGSQRKLKVTMDKCINYLQSNKFDNVSTKHKELAKLIGWWYDRNENWETALSIYNESLNAPRNIFTKVTLDENDKIVYDNNPEKDLREKYNENYSFEWLPKQDYNNLILGKYCNCCAHVTGAGQGIMRASMILDNCQNLVIRDTTGIIIAKSTLYVNKEKGYAVFNNVESSINYRDEEQLKKIYNAFLRGTKIFVKVYNSNNLENPIKKVTIGANRNTILSYLENSNHPEVDVLESVRYGDYSINGWSGYNGDWASKQRLVLKK